MRVLAVQHDAAGPPGLVGEAILANGCSLEITMPNAGGALPEDSENHDGLVILGGPQSACDDGGNPHYDQLMDLIRDFGAQSKPVMGICLGSQLIARAYGAEVRPMGFSEIGFTEISLTEEGRADPVFQGLPAEQAIMEFHDDTFDLPAGAELLMTGQRCTNQAFRVGAATYGFQCHHEVTEAIARNWATFPEAEVTYGRDDPAAKMDAELNRYYDGAKNFAVMVTNRWLMKSTKMKARAPKKAAE